MSFARDTADSEGFKFYHFTPSLPAAIIYAVLFLGLAIRHCQLLIRERAWFFIPFLVGCLCEHMHLDNCAAQKLTLRSYFFQWNPLVMRRGHTPQLNRRIGH